jgi:hypothetical protein
LIGGALLIFAGCGGGGGGGGVDITPTPAPPLPTSVLNFVVSAPATPANGNILSASISQPAPAPSLEILLKQTAQPFDFRLTGTFNRTTGDTTLNATGVNGSGSIVADATSFFPDLTANLTTNIIETVRWVNTDKPLQGAMQVDFEEANVPDSVTMRVNPDADGLGTPGVSLKLNSDIGNLPTSLTWDQFMGITADLVAPPWQKYAAMGYAAYDFMFRRTAIAFDNFQFFIENDAALEAAGTAGLSEPGACDVFPPTTGTAGEKRMVWNDNNVSGDLNGGDGFSVACTDCWVDDPTDDIDVIFRDMVSPFSQRMVGYIENATPFFLAGDFIFDQFGEVETTSSPFVEVPNSSIITNGRFQLQVFE